MIHINRKDIFWNYLATFLKLFSSLLLIPLILHKMPIEIVGIWNVFLTISSFLVLVDFGFNSAFTRTITYIFSGVQSIKTTGHETNVLSETNSLGENTFNKALLKGTIKVMQWFYLRLSFCIFLFLLLFGTIYIHEVLKTYEGNHTQIYISWILFVLINTYNLYTLYYETLLMGKGLIMRAKQIIIIGQITYLLIAGLFIEMGFNLIAIVSAQVVSVILIRLLSYYSIFTKDFNKSMQQVEPVENKKILQTILPNAVKIGMTSLGGFMVQKSAILIGSLYLSLSQIATYGITMQIINVIGTVALIYHSSYLPKITQLRVSMQLEELRKLYLHGKVIYITLFLVGGVLLYFFGSPILQLIKTKTPIASGSLLILLLLVSFIENNIIMASNIILSKNEVPFYKASLISGFFIVVLLFVAFKYTTFGLLGMAIIPLLVDVFYQGWKWPWDVIRDLHIKPKHYWESVTALLKTNLKFS